jgi:aryl-alcohol dehydrogenase-like predicted oxidoreductase
MHLADCPIASPGPKQSSGVGWYLAGGTLNVQQRQLGRDGPFVPVIGFGAWPIGGGLGAVDDRDAIRTLHHAFEQGVTLVDTAEAYRTSEELVGRALATWSRPRDRIFVATKVRGDDLSASHITKATERSLRRLGVDTIDLLQAHSWDAYHSIDETMQAFDRLVAAGKVRYVGVSNFDVPQMEAAWRVRPFQALQPRYNLVDREIEAAILPYCQQRGIGVLAHSPLAKGVLTGRYKPGHVFAADDERAQMARFQGDEFGRLLAWTVPLSRWAEERGHTLLELAIAWVLSDPAVTVCLCGAKSPEQIDDHIRAASWQLSIDDRRDIGRLLSNHGPTA